jgi:UDP:flavonoid glycosyltransferase YjiC (YdhE family)
MNRKKRILLMPSPPSSGSVGSVSKAIGIARILRKRGCDVRFLIGDRLGKLINSSGFSTMPYPVPKPSGITKDISNFCDALEWTGMADPEFNRMAIETEIKAIKEYKPHAIFAETRPTASISAAVMKVPLAMIVAFPSHPLHPANKKTPCHILSVFNNELRRYKLPEIENVTELLSYRCDAKIAPTIPELEPELQSESDINFVGYVLDNEQEKAQLPDWFSGWLKKPLILIYLSVSALPPDVYKQIIFKTFENDSDHNVLCLCGFHYKINDLPFNKRNIRFEYFVPAKAVLQYTKLMIFHGGQDTMLSTLLYGLPSITFPGQHFERYYNSRKLELLGASKLLPTHAFRPNRLKAVMSEVLNESYLSRCRQLSCRLKEFGGTERCVDIILSLT